MDPYVCGQFIVVSDILGNIPDGRYINKISRLDQAVEIASKRCVDENAIIRIYKLEEICNVAPKTVPKIEPVITYSTVVCLSAVKE